MYNIVPNCLPEPCESGVERYKHNNICTAMCSCAYLRWVISGDVRRNSDDFITSSELRREIIFRVHKSHSVRPMCTFRSVVYTTPRILWVYTCVLIYEYTHSLSRPHATYWTFNQTISSGSAEASAIRPRMQNSELTRNVH